MKSRSIGCDKDDGALLLFCNIRDPRKRLWIPRSHNDAVELLPVGFLHRFNISLTEARVGNERKIDRPPASACAARMPFRSASKNEDISCEGKLRS